MTKRLLFCVSLPVLAAAAAAQTEAPKVDWTKSGIPIKFYGFLRLDAYYDTARADNVYIPAKVNAEGAKHNDNEFALDPRLTRLGVDVLPGEVGGSLVSGKIEVDFASFIAGVSESRDTPRMRLAYVDVAHDDYALRFGQDWDVISPLYPAVNHELLQWNAGNLGDRRPQIQGRYTPKDSSFELKGCLGLNGAITNQDLDGGTGSQRDGFDSGLPHLQVRAGFKTDGLVANQKQSLGLWGMVGQMETDTAFNGKTRFDTWVVGADLTVPLAETLTFRGEAWHGEGLGDVRGGIGQTINTTTGNEIASTGGWAELVYKYTKQNSFHVGGSTDDPDNGDLANGNPKRNLVGYVGTVVDWDSGLRTGFDVLYWETQYQNAGLGNMVRFDLYFQYNF